MDRQAREALAGGRPQPLHVHERVAARAILAVAARQDVQRSLFADPELEYREAVRFYQHDVAWANRLILGDSLVVMASLAKHSAARRWVSAVNNWGQLGRWNFRVCHDPQQLGAELVAWLATPLATASSGS